MATPLGSLGAPWGEKGSWVSWESLGYPSPGATQGIPKSTKNHQNQSTSTNILKNRSRCTTKNHPNLLKCIQIQQLVTSFEIHNNPPNSINMHQNQPESIKTYKKQSKSTIFRKHRILRFEIKTLLLGIFSWSSELNLHICMEFDKEST